jgi:hypothetical protein
VYSFLVVGRVEQELNYGVDMLLNLLYFVFGLL